MKKLLAVSLLAACLACAGCSSVPFPAGTTSQLGADNAGVVFKYGGIYGPVTLVRVNPRPGQTVSYNGSDGTLTIGWVGGTNAVASPTTGTNSVTLQNAATADLVLHK